MGVLERILDQKRSELPALRRRPLPAPPPPRPVAFDGAGLKIFAEIKHRSPSAGALSSKLSVEERAAKYERAGASLVSVLCDESFFAGEYEHLQRARSACQLPLLCKEFVIDECQLDCARAFGADAVLLIVRCLDDQALERLFHAAQDRALLPLVEICNEDESRRAVALGASTIGVNARDLDTLRMDAERSARVLASLPKHIMKVHLSGISKPEDLTQVRRNGADGALVGEVLMRQDDPEPLLRSLVAAAAQP